MAKGRGYSIRADMIAVNLVWCALWTAPFVIGIHHFYKIFDGAVFARIRNFSFELVDSIFRHGDDLKISLLRIAPVKLHTD